MPSSFHTISSGAMAPPIRHWGNEEAVFCTPGCWWHLVFVGAIIVLGKVNGTETTSGAE